MKYLHSYIGGKENADFNSSSLNWATESKDNRRKSYFQFLLENKSSYNNPSSLGHSANFYSYFFRQKLNANYSKIGSYFDAEKQRSLDLIAEKSDLYDKTIDFLVSALSPLNTQNEVVNITPDGTIYCKFHLDENYIVRFEVFLDEVDSFSLEQIDVAITIKEDSQQIFGTLCSLKKLSTILFEQTDRLKITSPDFYEDNDLDIHIQESFTEYELDTSA